jgi:hypothetical protein
MRGFWDSLIIARRCCFEILKTSKIICLIREWTRQFLSKIRFNRDRSANHNRSEILWTDLPDSNPWNHNWEEHVFISVSKDGLSLATQWCYRAGEKLTHGFRPASGPSLHSPRFSGNRYAPSLLERRERFIKEKPTREHLDNCAPRPLPLELFVGESRK